MDIGKCALGAFILAFLCAAAPGSAVPRPNILLVVVESLRADHVGCYGYSRDTTPAFDGLAKEGVRFAQMISTSSWTTPSVMSIFTSELPHSHGVINVQSKLSKDTTTLAAELKRQGYTTIAVLVNPCAAAGLGFDRGFSTYDDFTVLLKVELNAFDAVGSKGSRTINDCTTSRELVDLALQYLDKAPKGKPWFLFLFLHDPHADYVPSREYASMFDPSYVGKATGKVIGIKDSYTHVYPDKRDLEHVIALYDGEIRYTDDQFRRLWQSMGAKGLCNENLLTIACADHGEEFNDHGGLQHARTLHEEVVRVPLIMHWPNHFPKGKAIKDQAQLIDLMPTILSQIGADVPKQCAGSDLSAVIAGRGTVARQDVALHLSTGLGEACALRRPTCKAIVNLKTGSRELFDLIKDPGEQSPLSDEQIQGNGEFVAFLNQLIAWNDAEQGALKALVPSQKAEPKLSTEQMDALRSMGYLH